MRYIFEFPDIGEGISEGKILKWYIEKGQQIDVGDPVVQMETDKVVADIPSPKSGTVVARFGKEGDVINVDDPLVEIEIEGVTGEDARDVAREKPKPRTREAVEEESYGVVGTLEVAGDAAHLPASEEGVPAGEPGEAEFVRQRRVLATPVARAMARELGVDIHRVEGSGPGGRVTKDDISRYRDSLHEARPRERAAVPAGEAERVVIEPLTQIRKTIARNMIQSKHNAAHMTVIDEVEISALMAARDRYRQEFEGQGVKLTYLPFVLKAVVAGLKRHRSLNSTMDLENDRMIYKRYYNIGIAVDTPEGLVVPVIRDVDRLSMLELARALGDIAERARERKLTMEDMKDGTFTVTNYGAIGGLFGVPVINYPQAAILGIGRIVQKPVVTDGQVTAGNVLPLSLSVDHRIVDGGDSTRFLADVMRCLNDPVALAVL